MVVSLSDGLLDCLIDLHYLADPTLHMVGSRGAWGPALGLLHAVSGITHLLQRQESACELQPQLQHRSAFATEPWVSHSCCWHDMCFRTVGLALLLLA